MLPVLVSDAMLCGAFARRDAASCSRLPSALASALGPILTGVLACDDDVVALLVELRDPSDKAGRLLLCAVTAHVSGCSSALLLSQFDNGDLRLYLCMPLLATARVDLMGNGVLALKSDGQAAYFKVSSILTLWTTAQSLIALRDGGGPGGAPAALLVRPEKQSGVGEELGVDSHDAVEVIGDGLFDMAIVLPPTPTKAGVYRKPDTKALEVRAPQCTQLTRARVARRAGGADVHFKVHQGRAAARRDYRCRSVRCHRGWRLTRPRGVARCLDVLAHIRSTFGEHIVGKWGYSKAYVDGIVFRVYGARRCRGRCRGALTHKTQASSRNRR